MALISCPECGRTVSDRAVACPACGRPIANQAQHSAPQPVQRPIPQPAPRSQYAELDPNAPCHGICYEQGGYTPEISFVATFFLSGLNNQGGKMHITKDKVLFEPHALNFGTTATRFIHIADVAGYNKGFMTWFYIYLKDGQKLKFAVWKKDAIIQAIESRRAKLFQEAGLAVPPLRYR